jgi:gamma-glutamylcyclotransferase (GGCT)/AIG2-like uncharacterized protein YtfP
MSELLFSYGTLQMENVQLNVFGRKPEGHRDAVLCYKLTEVEITDESVLAISGKRFHPIIVFTGNPEDKVAGTAFSVTPDELLKADKYEVSEYKRVLADLESGKKAWVYVRQNR